MTHHDTHAEAMVLANSESALALATRLIQWEQRARLALATLADAEPQAEAFRKANVDLPMTVEHWGNLVRVRAFQVRPEVLVSVPFDAEYERGAATRRAITIAAAEVHRRKEEAETARRKG